MKKIHFMQSSEVLHPICAIKRNQEFAHTHEPTEVTCKACIKRMKFEGRWGL